MYSTGVVVGVVVVGVVVGVVVVGVVLVDNYLFLWSEVGTLDISITQVLYAVSGCSYMILEIR